MLSLFFETPSFARIWPNAHLCRFVELCDIFCWSKIRSVPRPAVPGSPRTLIRLCLSCLCTVSIQLSTYLGFCVFVCVCRSSRKKPRRDSSRTMASADRFVILRLSDFVSGRAKSVPHFSMLSCVRTRLPLKSENWSMVRKWFIELTASSCMPDVRNLECQYTIPVCARLNSESIYDGSFQWWHLKKVQYLSW